MSASAHSNSDSNSTSSSSSSSSSSGGSSSSTVTVPGPDLMPLVNKIAKLVTEADALVIATGAGMGVHSGLGTFRGARAGVWPPLKKLNIDFTEMSNPSWFQKPIENSRNSANFAWAFWKYRYDAYTSTTPHIGYQILNRWSTSLPNLKKKYGAFSFTSNIDCHWERSGFPSDRIIECHGSLSHLQCSRPWLNDVCGHTLTPLSKSDMSFDIDPETDAAKSPLPTCKHCGSLARPNVLMFDDGSWIDDKYMVQAENYHNFVDKVFEDKNAKLLVIEIGAGGAVPSVRNASETLIRRFGNERSTLIRFNPEEPEIPQRICAGSHDHVSVTNDPVDVIIQVDKQITSIHSKNN